MTERITSRRNPLLEQVRRLDTAALRRKAGVFLCDSPKLVGEAVQHGVSVQCVIAADGVAFPEGLPENVRRVTVPADVMASISPMPTPQGMLALCALPDMAAPARLSPGRYVVLDGVQDPGNVGAVLRTADAFGCTGALLLPGCADPYGPKTLRAAMGAVFRLPLYAVGLEDLPRLLADAGLPLYGTALRHDTVDVRQRDLRRCALVIGRRPGRQRGGAGAVPRDAAYPHVVPLRVAERRGRGGGAAVGGLSRGGGELRWRL